MGMTWGGPDRSRPFEMPPIGKRASVFDLEAVERREREEAMAFTRGLVWALILTVAFVALCGLAWETVVLLVRWAV